MCDKVVSEDLFKLKHCHDRYIDDLLPVLNFAPEGSDDFIFCCNWMGIISIDLNNINLDDSNYDDSNPETIIQIRPSAWHTKFEKHKAV